MWKSIVLVLACTLPSLCSAQRFAFSFDDGFPIDREPEAQELNSALTSALARAHVKAIFFASGHRVDSPAGIELAKEWARHGHELANHSYAHWNLSSSTVT